MNQTTKTIPKRIQAVLQKLTSLSLTIQFDKELSPCFGALEAEMFARASTLFSSR